MVEGLVELDRDQARGARLRADALDAWVAEVGELQGGAAPAGGTQSLPALLAVIFPGHRQRFERTGVVDARRQAVADEGGSTVAPGLENASSAAT